MATLFTPSTEFVDVVDGLEAVTLKYPGASSTTAVSHAKRRQVSIREALASGGRYTTSDVAWHLPQSEATTQPKLGSKIVDSSSVYWTVIVVDKATRGTRWRCMTRALAIVAGLDTTVRIQRATYTKGRAGAAKATWIEFAVVKAKVQPEGGSATVQNAGRIFDRKFNIIIETDPGVDQHCRVIGADGATYKVLGLDSPNDITALPLIRAETSPAPEGR